MNERRGIRDVKYKAISADSHIVEPPHLWEKWLPPELRKFAPKLVKDHEGGDAWQYGLDDVRVRGDGLVLHVRNPPALVHCPTGR